MANAKKVLRAIKSTALSSRATPVAKQTVVHFGTQLIDSIDGPDPFSVSSPEVLAWLAQFAGERITRINETTRSRVRVVLERATRDGKSSKEIAEILTAKFDRWSAGRALSIARTEIARASNFGTQEAYRQAEVPQKEWLATDDKGTRDTHSELNGTIIDVDEEFESSSGATALYPGDFGVAEEDVNCRCATLPVINEKRLRYTFKMLEKERAPFDKKMTAAFAKGFSVQKAAVLAALGAS